MFTSVQDYLKIKIILRVPNSINVRLGFPLPTGRRQRCGPTVNHWVDRHPPIISVWCHCVMPEARGGMLRIVVSGREKSFGQIRRSSRICNRGVFDNFKGSIGARPIPCQNLLVTSPVTALSDC